MATIRGGIQGLLAEHEQKVATIRHLVYVAQGLIADAQQKGGSVPPELVPAQQSLMEARKLLETL